MKKSFYFALALTAGLFASCSSDDLTADAPQQSVEIDDSAPALIKLNIGSPNGTTRGTGSVGWNNNSKWEGQSFNIFMFEKGTLDLGYEAVDENNNPIYIFDNTELVTSTNADNANQADANFYVVNEETQETEIQFNYFPSNGKSYSFWAYRVDDANPGGAYKYTDDNGNEVEGDARTQVRVPFEIDGSQDIMIAETPDEEIVAGTLVTADAALGKTISLDDAKAKIYSAYSARREVNPKLNFSHKLTRLYFYVMAASKDVSNLATNKTSMAVDANGLRWYPGYKVTGVSVRSKSKGEVIAAYKGDVPEDAERVVWTDATQQWSNPASLAELQLRSRNEVIDDPDFLWLEIENPSQWTNSVTLDALGIEEGYYYLDSRTIRFDVEETKNNFDVYTNNAIDVDGQPTTDPIKWSAIENDQTVYLALTPMGTRDNGTEWTKKSVTYSASEDLKDELTAVTPKWISPEEENIGWNEINEVADGWTWTSRTANELSDEEKANATEIAGSTAINNAITAGTYKPENVDLQLPNIDAGTKGTIIAVTLGTTKYYELTAIHYNITGVEEVATLADCPADPANGLIVKVTANGKFYQYTAADENAGEGDPTLVGEAVLVAPEDEGYGYEVKFDFARCKKLTGTSWVEQTGSSTLTVKLKQAANFDPTTAEPGTAKAFQPGKAYKVTAVIYSDGEIKTDDVKIIEWIDGTEEMEDGGIVPMN